MESLNEKRLWNGTSPEGLAYEIAHWGVGHMCDGKGMWNYYVTIPEQQLRPEDWAKVWLPVEHMMDRSSGLRQPVYNEYDSILSAGEFHGGITFYEKGQTPDSDHRWIKVGCDYGHVWDRDAGYGYSVGYVQQDALRSCAKLAEVLNPLVRCTYTGRFFDPQFDMRDEVPGYRGPLSPGGMGARTMWARKDAEREAEGRS